ncbi:hypothetical protein U9M48_026766 [Paspalum notatum var. saurae]|uniref:MULE transposase domain-containing protein n=1 Tax=Paspalum notatum var. saurae TaxID=547442 RepID=A0AAQ3TT39_PASNO
MIEGKTDCRNYLCNHYGSDHTQEYLNTGSRTEDQHAIMHNAMFGLGDQLARDHYDQMGCDDLNYVQGGYTGLIFEQIRNSQEKTETGMAVQMSEEMCGSFTSMLMGDDITKGDALDLFRFGNLFENPSYHSNTMHRNNTIPMQVQATHKDQRHTQSTSTANGSDAHSEDISNPNWINDEASGYDEPQSHFDIFNHMDLEEDEPQPDHHEDHMAIDVSLHPNPSEMLLMGKGKELLSAQHDCTTEPNGSQELTEKEIEDFIENEQKAASEGNNADIASVYTPQVGMEFRDRYDAHYFFAFYGGQKYMTDMERAMIRTLTHNNIPTRKMIAILSHLRGGITALPYKKKDVSNYRTKINREVSCTDMSQVLSYFMQMKSEDPTFIYKIDLDEDKRLKNLFWSNGSAMKYYAEYGDFVSFDTTHMTNRYNLPFAPFVGVTGHAQTCVFGCAFLHDQTVGTFKWVFEAFLEAMGGKHPKTIITDQDNAMRAAIKLVFPDTVHRNCFFHIKNKCYSKNGKVFASNEGLMEEFEDTVNNSLTKEEFECLWTKMIADYGLENNNYFTRMWETREQFIPV